MIDVESLDELYPGSRPSQLPQVYDAPEPPQTRLNNRPEDEKKSDSTVLIKTSSVYDEELVEEIFMKYLIVHFDL